MTHPFFNDCDFCIHLDLPVDNIPKCKAFPAGIPDEIYKDLYDHTKPYPGDNGILFQARYISNKVIKHPLLGNQ